MRGEEQAAWGGLSDGTESGGSPVVQGRRGRARTRGGGEDGRGGLSQVEVPADLLGGVGGFGDWRGARGGWYLFPWVWISLTGI